MSWYWIVIIFIGFIVLWAFTAALLNRYLDLPGPEACALGLIIPVFLPLGLMLCLYNKFCKLVNKW